jgi:hypothetical protein
MPVIEFECGSGHRTSELVGMTMDSIDPEEPGPCPCGKDRRRVQSRAIGIIPPWMSDSGIESNKRHKDWLKTPEAKAMDLDKDRSEDPDHSSPYVENWAPSAPQEGEIQLSDEQIAAVMGEVDA